jgi:hypothetical protein
MMHTCQFVKAMQIIRLPYEGQKTKMRGRRPKDVVCGRPAEREVTFNANMEPLWLCAEHYDLLIGEGGSEFGMLPWKSN